MSEVDRHVLNHESVTLYYIKCNQYS